ncbi:MAG TPA: hydantoinase/oxoprolinase N-terminal domain-containing protein, partial [Candidatus Dormibacteraeota bacterium]|nr:hydantoinase/oxoprolinase N-terminal domain-containing protein [Candidatus Dormibacteraeota bacterium]
MSAGDSGWQIWIDTGGTFTDALGLDPQGRLHRAKILSSAALRGTAERHLSPTRVRIRADWSLPDDFVRGFRFRALERAECGPAGPRHEPAVARYDASASTLDLSHPPAGDLPPGAPFEVVSPEEAPVLATRLLTRTPPDRPLPAVSVRLATTLGTNVLLTRQGAPTALFITRGFGDLLRIGTQQRPDLFALDVRVPGPLYQEVVEVEERLAADGTVLRPLDEGQVEEEAARVLGLDIRSAAVALAHSHRNPAHERRLREILAGRGFRHISCSAELAPFIRLLPRAETAVVDACLAPVVRSYLERVRAGGGGRLHVMTSAGGLAALETIHPKDMLLSGPAGGVVGAAAAGRRAGFARVIAFDMGGTSTDVARYDGDYE